MELCAPLQMCISVYDDNWIIDAPEAKEMSISSSSPPNI